MRQPSPGVPVLGNITLSTEWEKRGMNKTIQVFDKTCHNIVDNAEDPEDQAFSNSISSVLIPFVGGICVFFQLVPTSTRSSHIIED